LAQTVAPAISLSLRFACVGSAGNMDFYLDSIVGGYRDEGYKFYSTHYTEFWREAKVLHENGLL
jgi:hypothetical protein